MNWTRSRLMALNAALLVSLGCTKVHQDATVAVQQHPVKRLQHDPTEAFTAWVICIDTSRSPLREEFSKLKAVIHGSVETDVDFNDLVWIIRIGDQFHPATLFQMPPKGRTRAERQQSLVQLRSAKEEILNEIETLEQQSGMTDLKNPIELGLNILVNQGTQRRFLVIGSDFVQDTDGTITSAPPKAIEGLSAKDVNVTLLLAYPDSKYLGAVGTSAAGLHRAVAEQWIGYFNDLGAKKTVAALVDAVPAMQTGEHSTESHNQER